MNTAKILLASFKAGLGLDTIRQFMAFYDDAPPQLQVDATTKAPIWRDGKLVFKLNGGAGAEELIDPSSIYEARSRITALNGEAMGHRQKAEAANTALKAYEGIDATKAREALEVVSKLDQKKLIDAGKVEEVRNEIKNSFQRQLTTATERGDKLQGRVNAMILSMAFRNSKLADKLAIPMDIAEATFARHFTVNNDTGAISAKDSNGNVIYSKSQPGTEAGFDEAFQSIIDAYPNKAAIMKGSGSSGSGSGGAGGNNGNKRTMTRADFDKLPANERAAFARDVAAGKAAFAE